MQKLIEGHYLGKHHVKGILLNSWKTLNMNNAHRVKLIDPQQFLGYVHTEVILFDEDISSMKDVMDP